MIAAGILIAWFAAGALLTVYYIDRPRPQITRGTAVFNLILSVIFILLVLSLL